MARCHTCGVEVPNGIHIVPPYLDESSFRCDTCLTPEEAELIDEDKARLKASCIGWDEIALRLDPWRFEKFCKWMRGQTTCQYGVFLWDYERFLDNLPPLD